MRVDGIVFDKDGTLFSFHETWSEWAAGFLRKLTGNDADRMQAIAAAIGFDLKTRKFAPDSIVIADTPDQIAKVLQPFFDMELPDLEAFLNGEAATTPQVQAVPLQPLFAGFKQVGLRIGLATNDAERAARAHLKNVGIIQHFDYIVGYDSGHGGKPMPGQCVGFLNKTGLQADRVAMVGDSVHDLEAGRVAGMQTIAVLTGVATGDELAPFADEVLPDIGHLPAWIKA